MRIIRSTERLKSGTDGRWQIRRETKLFTLKTKKYGKSNVAAGNSGYTWKNWQYGLSFAETAGWDVQGVCARVPAAEGERSTEKALI